MRGPSFLTAAFRRNKAGTTQAPHFATQADASVAIGQAAALTQQAQALAARMPDLIVQANRTAATLAAGQHPQQRAGWGDTFWQYRPAQPGEPAAHIDWRQSARSTHAYVRETEAESAQTILLWCDLSGSMNWQSRANIPTKLESAILLTLAMAAALARGGERIRLLSSSGMVHLPSGGSLLERLALALVFQASTPQKNALPAAAALPRHAHLLLASDLLCETDALRGLLHQCAARGVRTHVLHIADPAELSLPYEGRVEFTGLEGEPPIELPHVQTLRADYIHLASARSGQIEQMAVSLGHDYLCHVTDTPATPTLLALHNLMGRRV